MTNVFKVITVTIVTIYAPRTAYLPDAIKKTVLAQMDVFQVILQETRVVNAWKVDSGTVVKTCVQLNVKETFVTKETALAFTDVRKT